MMNVDVDFKIINSMASDKNIEMYETLKVASENSVRQKEGVYDTLQNSNVLLATERNTTCSLTCRRHVQPILIGVLYAIVLTLVLVSIILYVHSEESGKARRSSTTDTSTERAINELSKRVEKAEQENSKLKRRLEEQPNIAFTASRSSDLRALGPHSVIIFDETVSNFGNGYDHVTGQFIAPENGIYVFYANIMSEKGKGITFIETQFVKNGGGMGLMYSGASNSKDSSSNMVITSLQKGDRVWVRVHGSYSNNFSIHGLFSTFSGFCIAKG